MTNDSFEFERKIIRKIKKKRIKEEENGKKDIYIYIYTHTLDEF
jgi:hypothetical protein